MATSMLVATVSARILVMSIRRMHPRQALVLAQLEEQQVENLGVSRR